MPADILDPMVITPGAFATSRTISPAASRIALRAITYGEGNDASPPTNPILWGGRTMTLLANVDSIGSDVCLAVYYLLEADIAAMADGALSTPNGTFSAGHQADITWSVSGAKQAAPNFNSGIVTGTSGSLLLARVAESVTAAISVHDADNLFGASTNPATTSVRVASQNTTAYGLVTDTARNVSYGWSNSFNRDNASIVMNIEPAPTGPIFTTIDNPITSSITGTISASATATDYRVTAGGVAITHAVDGSPVTGTAFNITSLSRGNLPPLASTADTGAQATVELMNVATVVATTTTDLGNIPNTVGRVVNTPNTVATNSIFNPLYCTGTPVNNDQIRYWGDPGVNIDAAGLVTGEGSFTVEHWELATGTYGPQASYIISGGVLTRVRNIVNNTTRNTTRNIVT